MRGDGRVFQRGSRWWISYYHHGENYRRPGGKTEKEARKALRARLGELEAGVISNPREEGLLVRELLDALVVSFQTQGKGSGDGKASYGHMEPVREHFGHRKVLSVTPKQIEEYQAKRRALGKGAGTVNREVGVLRQAYRLAKKRDLIRRVPYFSLLPEPPPRQGFFEPDEVEAVAANLGEPLGDFVRFAHVTSWRKGELVGLTWGMVDRKAGEVRLPTSKNGRPRSVPIHGELAEIVERRYEARLLRGDLVFHHEGRPIGDFRKVWRRACAAAGVPGRLFHDLRRSGIRNMIRAGVSQSVAMAISGHRTISVFLRYNITSDADKREAFARTDAYRSSRTGTEQGQRAVS